MNKEEALAKLYQYSTCNYKEQIRAPEAKELLEYWSGIEKQIKQLIQENEKLKETLNLMGLNPNVILFLEEENKELQNKIHILEDELNWYKQECDDLEMRIGSDE